VDTSTPLLEEREPVLPAIDGILLRGDVGDNR